MALALGCLTCGGTSTAPPEPAPADCMVGRSSVCACIDGRTGAQMCQPDHTFGLCVCSSPAPVLPPPEVEDSGIITPDAPPVSTPTVCPSPTPVATNQLMLYDFEDGSAPGWFFYNDGLGTQFGTGVTPDAASILGGRGASKFAAHAFGMGLTSWGGAIAFGDGFGSCIDVSTVDGISFWAKGDITMRLTAVTPETQAAESGGDCTVKCYDSHHKDFKVTSEWKLISVRWNDLRQAGWGAPAAFSKHVLFYGFGLSVPNPDMSTPYDYWVDDVSYFIGEPPTAPDGSVGDARTDGPDDALVANPDSGLD
jgi:hypothetical protein